MSSMAGPREDVVLWQVEDGVGHIVLNHPEAANTLSTPLALRFGQVVGLAAQAVGARTVGAIVLSARGKQFCAGGDIHEFVERLDDFDRLVVELLAVIHPAVLELTRLPVPVITAVHAPIGGAGIALGLCGDFVLASTTMKLRGGYSAIGLSPDVGASYFLVRRGGVAFAKHVLMTNRPITAEECLRRGLVDELHAPDALMPAVMQLARQLAGGARQSVAGIKRLCEDAAKHELQSHLELEQELLLKAARSAEGREGIMAFVEKRAPNFAGK